MKPSFIIFVLSLVVATYGFYQVPVFPAGYWGFLGILIGGILLFLLFNKIKMPVVLSTIFILLLGGIIGFQNSFWQSFYAPKLPIQTLNKTILVTGQVIGLPTVSQMRWQGKPETKTRFELSVSKIKIPNSKLKQKTWQWSFNPPKIRLNAYNLSKTPRPGQILTLWVKLKENHASLNPGGFDYETYLFQKHWAATGYVKKWVRAVKISSPGVRYELDQALHHWFASSQFKAFYLALLVGDKSLISAPEWTLLQRTGTIHLMAISGLHIGIIAGLGFALFGFLWRQACRISLLARQTPKIYFAALGALLFASVYLVLAGASVPTQRAWFMVMAVLIFVLMKRQFQPWTALSLAAMFVVLWQPTAVLSAGFWLSFTAVALIFSVLFHPWVKPLKNWQKAILIQLVLSVGLMPWVAYYYQQVPLFEALANFVVVPVVSLLALPLLFLMVLLHPISTVLNHYLLAFSDHIWFFLMGYLQAISDESSAVWPLSISLWQVGLFYVIIFIILNSHSFNQRFKNLTLGFIGSILLILTFLIPTILRHSNTTKMTLLDVGQGLALVVTTPHHTIVYDTGGYWSPKLDGGTLAVLPYLKYHHRSAIDLMIVSHSDIDHAGGAHSILKAMPVKIAVSGQPTLVNQLTRTSRFMPCFAGQSWQFDDLKVRVLSPLKTLPLPKSDNDHSCVVAFSVNGQQILVTGDLSQRYEKRLVAVEKSSLPSQILVAGHHGSKTASSLAFLQAVKPKTVLFSAGYLNRFHFPNKVVIQRLHQLSIPWWNTACDGAMTFVWHKGQWQKQESYRQRHAKWYHHRCNVNQKGRLFQ